MFRAPITSTPFVGQYTDAFFPNINGESYQGDVSFLSTMRALLAPKMKEKDGIYLRFMQTNPFKASSMGDKKEFIKSTIDFRPSDNELIVYNLRGDADANSKLIEELRKEFPKLHKGYQEVVSIAEFYKNSFPCICFKNEKTRTIIYFVGRLNMRSMHYLQASIPVPCTWFVPEVTANTFGEDGWALIKSLASVETTDEAGNVTNNGADEYLRIITKMSEKYDFEKARLKTILGGFEERQHKREIDQLKANVAEYDRNIERYQHDIMSFVKSRDDTIVRIWGLEHKIETLEGESELLDYFMNNKSLYLLQVNNDKLEFAVGTYLTYVDPAALDKIMKNPRSVVARYETSTLSKEDMQLLLRAALIDNKIKLRICAAYSLGLGSGVSALSHYTFPDRFNNYMRNSHVDGARCLGSYVTPITNALKNGNFVGAIEQCIASAMSQNVLESVTFDPLIQRLYDRDHAYRDCFELPDGRVVSPEEAVKWLKEEEAKKAVTVPNEQKKRPAKKAPAAKEGEENE